MVRAVSLEIAPLTLRGAAVSLVPLTHEHDAGLFAAGGDERIFAYLSVPPFARVVDAHAYIATALANAGSGTELPFAVTRNADGAVVGTTRYLEIRANDLALEIGWTFYAPAVWRTRVNTECKYLLLRHAFETLGTVRVQLKTDARNERSRAAIGRIGAQFEGILRKYGRRPADGYVRDTAMFSIIDDEWPAVKARLERMLDR